MRFVIPFYDLKRLAKLANFAKKVRALRGNQKRALA
jgi:hypothetical protein